MLVVERTLFFILKLRIDCRLLNKNPLLCCTMVDFFEWIPNQLSLRTLFGTCHDYNTQTDINSFDVSKCPG